MWVVHPGIVILTIIVVICLLFILNKFRSRIAVCSLSDRPSFTEHTWRVMSDYCAEHGYDLVTETRTLDSGRHPAWSKFLLIEKVANLGYDIIVWIDDDIVITEPSVSITSLFKDFLNSDSKIGVSLDGGLVGEANTGLLCVKREGVPILKRIWDEGLTDSNRWGQLWEQTAFNDMLDVIGPDIYMYPFGVIQGFYRDGLGFRDDPESKWRPGVWSAHVSGIQDQERRLNMIKELADSQRK